MKQLIYSELVIGAGNCKDKKIFLPNKQAFSNVTTLDIDPLAKPDVLWDLNVRPLPFKDEQFDEIHAYEVLEHIGKQGDWKGFFEEFTEYWRILKPGGIFFASTPSDPIVAWSDPGHVRYIGSGTLVFLSQKQYQEQIGKTAMTDYRDVWKKDFDIVHLQDHEGSIFWGLRKVLNNGSGL